MPLARRLLNLCAAIAVAAVLLQARAALAENWPQWRGAKLDGVSNEKGIPVKWSKTEGVLWRLPMPGQGGSTPIVWDDRIFVTSADGKDLVLICVGTDGKEQWRQTVATGDRKVRDDEGNAASPSASTDGKFVWTFMATGDLACFTVEGQPVWKFNVQDRYGKLKIQFGMTSTPVLDGDQLYLQLIHGEGDPKTREATVVSLEAATGKEIWHVGRDSDAIDECEHSYASPVIYRDDKQAFLLTHGADYIVAHRLEDGKEIWRCGNLNLKTQYNNTLRFVASPVAVPGMIIVPSAKNGPVLALRPDGEGNITEAKSAYYWMRDRNTPDVPSPLVKDDIVYLCRENGVLIAVDAASGKELYQERVHLTRHRASPVFADGHIYLTGRDGTVNVVAHGPEFKIVATNKLGEEMSASPAIANGRIYLRTFDALYAIGEK
ncbi:MAG: PQQ-binding-like beta-propeller repeat protein [Pirellulales bacterium]